MQRLLVVAVGVGLAIPARASAQDLRQDANRMFQPIPSMVPAVRNNAVTREKVQLGLKLFFDPRLSRSQVISCSTCHNLGTGGVDAGPTSIGHGWQKGPRNAPTVLNAVFNTAQFWDGRAEDLKAQAKGPVQASVEMANDPARLLETLKSIPGYGPMFQKAFPAEKEPITFDNVAAAIEIFEATLLTPGSAFDRFLKGDRKALNAEEQAGLALFLDSGCVACHSGVNVGGDGYYAFGLVEKPADEVRPPSDTGRFKLTHTPGDEFLSRSPTLRNIAITQPYFHSGRVWKLQEAVRIMGIAQLGARLTEVETGRLTAFLRTLTGVQPKVLYPVLPPGTDATPQADLSVPTSR